MKILMVTDFYLPIVGGTEIYFQSLGRQLVRRGHEVSIATTGHPQLPEYEEDSGVNIYRLQGLFQKELGDGSYTLKLSLRAILAYGCLLP